VSEKADNIAIESLEEWHTWLSEHADQTSGIWVVYPKGENARFSSNDLVEEAICYGWIDSKPGKVDGTHTKLYFAPRNPKSNWSAVNKARVAKLEKEGRIAPRGKQMIEEAKRNGAWTALDEVSQLVIPHDLAEVLKVSTPADIYFEQFPASTKRGILEWIHNAKTPQTRQKRIVQTASLARDNLRANQWPRK